MEGMKRLIVEEVNSFRAMVRSQARAASQVRRQDRYDPFSQIHIINYFSQIFHFSLPVPSRDDIINSPITEDYVDAKMAIGSNGNGNGLPPSPMADDPSIELERELAQTHLGRNQRQL